MIIVGNDLLTIDTSSWMIGLESKTLVILNIIWELRLNVLEKESPSHNASTLWIYLMTWAYLEHNHLACL